MHKHIYRQLNLMLWVITFQIMHGHIKLNTKFSFCLQEEKQFLVTFYALYTCVVGLATFNIGREKEDDTFFFVETQILHSNIVFLFQIGDCFI